VAKRPVFIPKPERAPFVEEIGVEFEWFPGFSVQQKQRSIASLHETAETSFGLSPLLEISSKSPREIGKSLSAFHLMIDDLALERPISVEAAFQGSKVFEHGGPYTDLYEKSAREAKRDSRLKVSGRLLCFDFGGIRWKLEPKTAFYDWLYLRALQQHSELAQQLLVFRGFTDIEFNPQKSINCQARAAALYVALASRGLLPTVIETPESYLEILSKKGELEAKQTQFPFLSDEE